MTAKEIFLNNILHEIDVLQTAYNNTKDLPDSLFELMKPISKPVNKPTANGFPSLHKLKDAIDTNPIKFFESNNLKPQIDISEYGANKKLILDILKAEGMAMVKWNITARFAEMSGKPKEEISETVTNAISALKMDKLIIGYKPKGLVFKGLFWGLSEWFNGENIKSDYSPYKQAEIKQL